MSKLSCAVYLRVSTEEQVKQYGLGAQLAAITKRAAELGWQIDPSLKFVDEGCTGGDLDRPALQRLMQAVREKRAPRVLVFDPDRLVRKFNLQCVLIEEFKKAGARVEFVTTPVEDNPESQMFFQMKGVFAEYEKEKIRYRTLGGRHQKARLGFIVGGIAPYGYRYLGKAQNERGRYVVDEAEMAHVRQMFAWLIDDDLSVRQIVTRLNEIGVKPRRSAQWAKSSVRRILSNPLYAGQAYYNRRRRVNKRHEHRSPAEWIPIAVPPIVSDKTHQQALDQLRQNAEHLRKRIPGNVYLLRGLIRCGACGQRFGGCPSHGQRFYRCMGRDRLRGVKRCKAGLIYASRIEGFTWTVVDQILRDPRVLIEKLRAVYSSMDQERGLILDKRRRLEKELRGIETQEARLVDLRLKAKYWNAALLTQKGNALSAQTTAIARELAAIEKNLQRGAVDPDAEARISEFSRQALRGLDKLDDNGRQQLFRHLLDEVRLDGERVVIRGVVPGLGTKDSEDWRGCKSTTPSARCARYTANSLPGFTLDASLTSEPSLDNLELSLR